MAMKPAPTQAARAVRVLERALRSVAKGDLMPDLRRDGRATGAAGYVP